MSELRVPLDYEQLTELSQLRLCLKTAWLANRANAADGTRKSNAGEIDQASLGSSALASQAATFLFFRLFVTLGYLARSTNKPGHLTKAGALQFRESLEPLYGDDCDPIKLLEQCGLLVARDEEWECPLFGRMNGHLAGDYRPPHMRGNEMRQVSIGIKAAAVAAPKQVQLIPEEIKKPDGTRYELQELERMMILVSTLDRFCKFTRQRSQMTEGLMATAWQACQYSGYTGTTIPEDLRQFFGYVCRQFEVKNPRMPQTTEEILRDFEVLYRASKPN